VHTGSRIARGQTNR